MWKVLFVLLVLVLIWMFSKDAPPAAPSQQGVAKVVPTEAPSVIDNMAAWMRENTPKK